MLEKVWEDRCGGGGDYLAQVILVFFYAPTTPKIMQHLGLLHI